MEQLQLSPELAHTPFNEEKFFDFTSRENIGNVLSMEARIYKKKVERIKIFFALIHCGLYIGNGFVVSKEDAKKTYLVKSVDLMTYEITGIAYDFWVPEERLIELVSAAINVKYDSIEGYKGSITIEELLGPQ